MKAKLKRCPFCNSHDLQMDSNQSAHWVHCLECAASGPNGWTKNTATQLWNGHHKHQNESALVINRKSNHHEMKEIEI